MVLLGAVLLLAGCPRGEPRDPADYDRSCTVNSDCVLVFERSCPCECDCRSPLGAVNVNEEERFNKDEEARPCPQRLPGTCVQCDCAFEPHEARCVGGTCTSVALDGGQL